MAISMLQSFHLNKSCWNCPVHSKTHLKSGEENITAYSDDTRRGHMLWKHYLPPFNATMWSDTAEKQLSCFFVFLNSVFSIENLCFMK